MALCIETNVLESVQRILASHFGGMEVWAHGARVSGVDLAPDTELELVVVGDKLLSIETMTAAEKAFVDAKLPFRVDLMDWAKLPESLQKQIKKEHDVVQSVEES